MPTFETIASLSYCWRLLSTFHIRTQGHFGGFYGVTNSKILGSCQTAGHIGTKCWHTCADSSGNGYSPNILPLEKQGGAWGFRGSNIQKSWEVVKRLYRLAPTLVHVCGLVWEWTYAKYNSPLHTPEGISGGLGSHTFKSLGKLSNGWTEWNQTWYTSADSSGTGYRLNTIRPSIPRGHFRGVILRGHTFKTLGKLSNGWTDWHQNWYTSADSSGNGHRLNTIRP